MTATCPSQGKFCYPSQTRAIKVALASSRKRGVPLRVYFHRECKSWHLTRSARRDNNASSAVA